MIPTKVYTKIKIIGKLEGASQSKISKIEPIKKKIIAKARNKLIYTTVSWSPAERNKIPPPIDGTIDLKEALTRGRFVKIQKIYPRVIYKGGPRGFSADLLDKNEWLKWSEKITRCIVFLATS